MGRNQIRAAKVFVGAEMETETTKMAEGESEDTPVKISLLSFLFRVSDPAVMTECISRRRQEL